MGDLIAAAVVCIVLGSITMAFGFRIWWHRKIGLIFLFPHGKVKAEDVEEYTQQMGKACALDGLGAFSMGAFWILYGIFQKEELIYMGIAVFAIAIGFSVVRMYRAQKRYA